MSEEILKIKDLNKGAILKQGDNTTLKYYLYDADEENIESIIGTTAEVVFIKDNQVYYRTNGTINDLFICEFKIEEVLPSGVYHIEFLVDGRIFPSMYRPYFTLTPSSKGITDQIITAHGFEEVVVLALEEVESRSAARLAELELNYATRLVDLETNDESITAQLAQTDMFSKTRDSYGSPIYPVSRLKLLAPLDSNLKNYVGKNIILSNDSSDELPTKLLATFNENVTNFKDRAEPVNNSALAYANMSVGKGVKFDGTQGLTYTLAQVNHMNSGGISFKFKPLKDLKDTDNIEYNFLYGYNSEKTAFYANLNYLDSGGIKGLNIRIMNSPNIFIATVPNVNFNIGQEYHAVFTWEWDGKSSFASAHLFLDGVYQRSWTFNPNCLPTGLNKVIVGNAPAFNRPAQSIMSDLIIINDDFSPTNIQDLSTLPLDPRDANIQGAYGNIETGKFYKGHIVNGKKRLIAPLERGIGNTLEGSASVRIKPLADIKQGINKVKKLFTLVSDLLGDVIDVNLNYDTATNIQGLEVKMTNGTLSTTTSVRNMEFLENVSYTIGVEWKITPGQSEGYLCVYVNGRLLKVTSIHEQNKPSNIYQMRIGNNNTLNQPIDSVVEAVVYGERAIGTYGNIKLHHSVLDLSAVSRGDAYTSEFEAVGYSGEKVSHIILNEIEGRLFGVQDIRFGVMKVSDDEGTSWKDYYNFGSAFGLSNPRIDFIEKFNGYEFVGIRDGNTHAGQIVRSNAAGGYTNILSSVTGRYMVNDWNWTTYQNTIVVSEYGQNANVPSKTYRSIDNGDTWQVIFTAPTGTNHIHSAKFDPYTGWLYLVYGDNVTELLRSKDRGDTWQRLDNDLTNKVISFTFKRDAIYMSCDYYGGFSLLRVWDKTKDEMFRLSPQTKTHNVHTYAVYFDKAGYMWWYSFADGGSTMTDRHSSFYISGDHGISEVRLEDRGRETISYPYRFIETDNFMWFGNYKMTKPALRRLM